jgi:hypothetical protein
MNQLIKTLAEDTAITAGALAQSTVVPIDNEPTPRLIVELPGGRRSGPHAVAEPFRVTQRSGTEHLRTNYVISDESGAVHSIG